MLVNQLIDSDDPKNGGPLSYMLLLKKNLDTEGINNTVNITNRISSAFKIISLTRQSADSKSISHCLWSIRTLLILVLLRLFTRTQIIIFIHGMNSRSHWVKQSLLKKCAGFLICELVNLCQILCVYGTPDEECRSYFKLKRKTIIPNLSPSITAQAALKHYHTAPNKTIKFVYFSRIVEHKGLLEFIQVFKKIIAKTHLNLELTIYGIIEDPDFWQRVQLEIHNINSIHVDTRTRGPALQKVIHNYDIFVLWSSEEGMPMSALEAAAAGLKLLISSQCNLNHLLKSDISNFNSVFDNHLYSLAMKLASEADIDTRERILFTHKVLDKIHSRENIFRLLEIDA